MKPKTEQENNNKSKKNELELLDDLEKPRKSWYLTTEEELALLDNLESYSLLYIIPFFSSKEAARKEGVS